MQVCTKIPITQLRIIVLGKQKRKSALPKLLSPGLPCDSKLDSVISKTSEDLDGATEDRNVSFLLDFASREPPPKH